MATAWRQRGAPDRAKGVWRSRGRPATQDSTSQIRRDVSVPPNRRQMEHIASVSRSSGLEKDGDTLKDFEVQEEYRVFLQGKIDDVFSRHSRRAGESELEARQRVDAQENVLILFRKLREGISSSRRNDAFALEAYETSLYLTVVFDAPRQTTSIIPHLPEMYLSIPPPHRNCHVTILVSLVHHLVAGYPSQLSFRKYFDTIPSSLLDATRNQEAVEWIHSLSRSLRTRNYIKVEKLTCRSAIYQLFKDSDLVTNTDLLSTTLGSLSISPGSQDNIHMLPRRALDALVVSLRERARATAWDVIRAAYRELTCTNTPEGDRTRDWLVRSLCLRPLVSHAMELDVETWLDQQSLLGSVRRKDSDVNGKWIVCKVR